MKYFNLPEPSGGHKIYADDIRFIHDALKEGFTALALGGGNSILSGLQYSAYQTFVGGGLVDIVQYTGGYVMLDGEIYKFETTAFDISLITDPCLVPYETVIVPSPTIAADATNKNVHFSRVARVEQYAAQSVKYRIKELKNYSDPFHTVDAFGTPFSNFVFTSAWAQTGVTDFEPLKIRKIGDELEIQGVCKTAAFSNGDTILTLPTLPMGVKYRPAKIRSFPVSCKTVYTTYSDEIMNIDIQGTGAVQIASGTYSGSTDLYVMFNNKIPLY